MNEAIRLPSRLSRYRKNWRALYAVAKVAGGEWPERARKATAALAVTEDDDETIVVKLLGPSAQ